MFGSTRPRRLQVVAAAAALVAAAAVIPATADAGVAPASGQAAAQFAVSTGDDDSQRLDIPGLSGASHTVTLVTGDRVTLTADGRRYVTTAQTATRVGGDEPPVVVETRTDPQGRVRALTATPEDVKGAIAAGVVDPGLFDLSALLKGDEHDPEASIPVSLKYGDLTGSELQKRATALPGATVDDVNATSNTVAVTVDPDRAARFWAAVAPDLSFGDEMGLLFDERVPRLAGGVRKVWRTGYRPPSVPQVDTEEPLHTVTVRITKKVGDPFYCVAAGARVWILCLSIPDLVSVDGRSPGTTFHATAGECLEEETCSEIEITYDVPAGKYLLGGSGLFMLGGKTQNLDLMVPEFEVTGDRTLRINGDSGTKADVVTPEPNEPYDAVFSSFRTYSDGSGGSVSTHVSWSRLDHWAIPSSAVTVGRFHLSQVWMLGKPLVKMTVTEPKQMQLHPAMSGYEPALPEKKVVRFDGHSRAELVDVGLGRAEDFAGLDVAGKLVLMKLDASLVGGQCDVKEEPLERARSEGAVGVIVDPFATNGPFPDMVCTLPIEPSAWGPELPPREVPEIPWAAIPRREVAQLRALLEQGDDVEIDVNGFAGTSPYNYHLEMYQYGRIPASMRTRLTRRDLQTETTKFHGGPGKAEAEIVFSAFNPVETVVGGLVYQGLAVPSRTTISRGPVTPDLVWRQWPTATDMFASNTLDVVDDPGTRLVRWNAQPVAPGVVDLPSEVFAAQPGKWEDDWAVEVCTFCREGDVFYPTLNLISGAAPGTSNFMRVFAPKNVRLWADGQRMPQESHFFYGPTFRMPPESTKFRLVGETATSRTAWKFRSARTAQARAPQGYLCPSWFSTPGGTCQFEPMLFLRYRINTDLRNAVPARAKRILVVQAYRPLDRAPRVKQMRVSMSVDSGETWQRLPVNPRGGGEYGVKFKVPALGKTDGALAFKVTAKAKDGSVTNQVIREAVRVKK